MDIHDFHSMRNRHQIRGITFGSLLTVVAVFMLFIYPLGTALAVPGVLLIVISLATMPCKITFDEEGFTLHYVLTENERYLWSNIELIEAEFHNNGEYMYVPYEKVPRKEKKLKQYKFPKRRKSEVALSLYYTGKIEDEQRDGIPWY